MKRKDETYEATTYTCACCEATYPISEAQARGLVEIDCPTEACGFVGRLEVKKVDADVSRD